MLILLLIAALVLLFVPGLFAAQATVGMILLGVLAAVFVVALVYGLLGLFLFKKTERRMERHFKRF